MRLENHDDPQQHSRQNGSSLNGGSPHTNGASSAVKNGNGETNGTYTNGHANGEEGGRDLTAPFYGHDREEVTRILLQSLGDLGYAGAARQLSVESGYALEIPSVAAFRRAVLGGEWEEAEELLLGERQRMVEGEDGGGVMLRRRRRSRGSVNGSTTARQGLPLSDGADITMLKFLLRQQKYLELLEARDLNAALSILRNEITPLKKDVPRLHLLSSLMMCQSAEDLRAQADWDGAAGTSRNTLLSDLSASISPSVMIPEHRLATLISDFQQQQILNCLYHNTSHSPSLYTDHSCSPDDFPLHTMTELRNHSDEVWHLAFSNDGSMLATAGKDGLVCVCETQRWKLRHEFREHERTAREGTGDRGVVFVAFSPNNEFLISCSQNNEFVVVSLRDGRRVATADHFDYPVSTAAWLPDSETFVVGSQGSRMPLGLYSIRPPAGSSATGIIRNNEIHSWRDPPWDATARDSHQPASFRISDCAVTRDGTRMVATTLCNKIMLYDLNSREKISEWQMEEKLTSVKFSADGTQVLVNMNEGRVLLIRMADGEVVRGFEGVRQRHFVVRSGFGGGGEGFVVSGSEDSRVYIWRRQTGVLVAALDAHGPGAVNAVAWHPTDHAVFASAGDDRRVRIWSSAAAIRLQASEGRTASFLPR